MGHEEADIRAVAESIAEDLYAGDPDTYAGVRAGFGDEGSAPNYNTVQIGQSELLAGGSWNGGAKDSDNPGDGPNADLDGNSGVSVLVRAIALVLQAVVKTATNPGGTDDETKGYRPGKLWLVTSTSKVFVLMNAAAGSAIWLEVTAAGGGSGTTLQVNGAALTATTANLNDTTPAAPSDGVNVRVQKDVATPTRVSANVPVDNATIVPSGGALAVGSIPESKVSGLVSDLNTLAAAISAITISSLGGVPTSRHVDTNAPLTGGGALTSNLTLALDIDGSTVVLSAGKLAVGSIPESSVTNLTSDLNGKASTSTTISTTSPLNGGGSLAANRTLTVDDASSGGKGVLQLTDNLGGSATAPKVVKLHESGGTDLALGAWNTGLFGRRSGTTVIGDTIGVADLPAYVPEFLADPDTLLTSVSVPESRVVRARSPLTIPAGVALTIGNTAKIDLTPPTGPQLYSKLVLTATGYTQVDIPDWCLNVKITCVNSGGGGGGGTSGDDSTSRTGGGGGGSGGLASATWRRTKLPRTVWAYVAAAAAGGTPGGTAGSGLISTVEWTNSGLNGQSVPNQANTLIYGGDRATGGTAGGSGGTAGSGSTAPSAANALGLRYCESGSLLLAGVNGRAGSASQPSDLTAFASTATAAPFAGGCGGAGKGTSTAFSGGKYAAQVPFSSSTPGDGATGGNNATSGRAGYFGPGSTVDALAWAFGGSGGGSAVGGGTGGNGGAAAIGAGGGGGGAGTTGGTGGNGGQGYIVFEFYG
jgi:hypothetical protein